MGKFLIAFGAILVVLCIQLCDQVEGRSVKQGRWGFDCGKVEEEYCLYMVCPARAIPGIRVANAWCRMENDRTFQCDCQFEYR